jgi:hypothetical protein
VEKLNEVMTHLSDNRESRDDKKIAVEKKLKEVMTHVSDNRKNKDDKKIACNTFVEQTKLLTSLASAFIVAPAVVKGFTDLVLGWQVFGAEILFVISVLGGYFTLAAITGTQFKGIYNVYRPAIQWGGRIQFFAYVFGIALFGWWLASYPSLSTGTP